MPPQLVPRPAVLAASSTRPIGEQSKPAPGAGIARDHSSTRTPKETNDRHHFPAFLNSGAGASPTCRASQRGEDRHGRAVRAWRCARARRRRTSHLLRRPGHVGCTEHMQAALPGQWGATGDARRSTGHLVWPAEPIIPGFYHAPNRQIRSRASWSWPCRAIPPDALVSPKQRRASLNFRRPENLDRSPRMGADCRVCRMVDLVAGESERRAAAGIFGRHDGRGSQRAHMRSKGYTSCVWYSIESTD
jgi:hypothetical protein